MPSLKEIIEAQQRAKAAQAPTQQEANNGSAPQQVATPQPATVPAVLPAKRSLADMVGAGKAAPQAKDNSDKVPPVAAASKPAANPAPASQPKTSLAALINAHKNGSLQATRAQPAKPHEQQTASGNKSLADLLRGTGLTKKLAESAQKQANKVFAAPEPSKNAQPKGIEKHIPPTSPEKLLAQAERELAARNMPEQAPSLGVPVIKLAHEDAKGIGIEWDASQLAAIQGILENQFSCLIGAAGTGKTTVTREVINQMEQELDTVDLNYADPAFVKNGGYQGAKNEGMQANYGLPIAFCAFTGRAVQQMKRALPDKYHKNAMTIHKLLGYEPVFYDDLDDTGNFRSKMRFEPTFTAMRKLPHKIIVIDEASMLAVDLWNTLFEALHDDVRILMIGDINQLPPVHGRSVLGFAMTKWPTFELTKIHRQAADNPIIANAHRILNGQIPVPSKGRFDVFSLPDGKIGASAQIIAAVKKFHKEKTFDETTDALIVPQNKSELGQVHLNEMFVPYFNPIKKVEGVVINQRIWIKTGSGTAHYAPGDKVMLLANDTTLGLTNGMIGTVTQILPNGSYDSKRADSSFHAMQNAHDLMLDFNAEDIAAEIGNLGSLEDEEKKENESEANQRQASHITTVMFGEQECKFQTAGEYRKLAHAYAITCHKSQGGEYPVVVIALHSANNRMLSREWFYTAVTRARERVIILANNRAIQQACARQMITGRTLADKIKSFQRIQDESNMGDVNLPELPEPRRI